MVPILISETGRWLDRFNEALCRWESMLNEIQEAYLLGNHVKIAELCPVGEAIHLEIQSCKQARQALIQTASGLGYAANSLRELSVQLDSKWPSLWTHRITKLELHLNRIQQLSLSLWVSAFQSKSFVSEMLLILSTGKPDSATDSPRESHSFEVGFLIHEAA
jgi:hypothetical protein